MKLKYSPVCLENLTTIYEKKSLGHNIDNYYTSSLSPEQRHTLTVIVEEGLENI